MNKRILLIFAVLWIGACAKVDKVRVLVQNPPYTYESLGVIEVKKPVRIMMPDQFLFGTAEVLTLSLAKTPDQTARIKASLNNALIKKARNHYQADAVINVEYWPKLDSNGFPDGFAYARGEMIRYQSFVDKQTA